MTVPDGRDTRAPRRVRGWHPGRSGLGLFLGQALKRPGRTGAVAPSSPALARAMTEGLTPADAPVIELGGGTGRITDAILARGIAPGDLTVIESNRVFCELLRVRFPGVAVRQLDARHLDVLPAAGAGAVISGLPMLSIPAAAQHEILAGAFRLLRPGGVFVQFTYGWRASVAREVREALGLRWTVSRRIWANMPPARVYRFTREG